MGWEIIAIGSIEFRKNSKQGRIVEFAKKLDGTEFVMQTRLEKGFINVEMSGNKGIDYEPLTKLCDEYKDIIDGTISFGEYSETGDGFFWEPTEEEE